MKSDQELMTDFRNGDRPAFHKLIRRHHVAILNFFQPLTGSHAAAEELIVADFQVACERISLLGRHSKEASGSAAGIHTAPTSFPFDLSYARSIAPRG